MTRDFLIEQKIQICKAPCSTGNGMTGLGLVRYDAMCRAISACVSVDEVKDIRDKARALEVYAQQARNLEAERKAVEVRIRAERRAGQLLYEMKQNGQRHNGTSPGPGRGKKV
jgi:hypothetical protein